MTRKTNLMTLLTAVAAMALLLTAPVSASEHEKVDTWENPDHCANASDRAREAANDFGHANLGDAAEKAGEAAAAGVECAKDAFGGDSEGNDAGGDAGGGDAGGSDAGDSDAGSDAGGGNS
jgi:hypothetical protein